MPTGLECAALSGIWSAAAWGRIVAGSCFTVESREFRSRLQRTIVALGRHYQSTDNPGIPGAAAALGWRGGALQEGLVFSGAYCQRFCCVRRERTRIQP